MKTTTFEVECCCTCHVEKILEAFGQRNSSVDDEILVRERQVIIRSNMSADEIVSIMKQSGFTAKFIKIEQEK